MSDAELRALDWARTHDELSGESGLTGLERVVEGLTIGISGALWRLGDVIARGGDVVDVIADGVSELGYRASNAGGRALELLDTLRLDEADE